MTWDSVFGLPTHILVVHAAVVLLPLASVGAVVMAVRSDWSRRFGPVVVAVAAVGLVSAFLARRSGEEFSRRVGTPQPHAELGEVLPWIALAFFVLTLALWLLDRRTSGRRSTAVAVLAVLVVAAAALTTLWTIRVGHSGSEAVWEPIMQNTQPR